MSNPIGWTDQTWNPVTGCTPISEGCAHCYARRMAQRLKGRYGYPADEPFRVTLHPDRLDEPLHWRKPRHVFVCSMGDLFHEDVPDEYIAQVWACMAVAPKHTFQVLTKRPDRMRSLLNDDFDEAVHEAFWASQVHGWEWPLPNVWLGVTAEDQQRADERIPILLDTPAAVRFVSCEPLLGPVDLDGLWNSPEWCPVGTAPVEGPFWVIAGGETGPGARPLHPGWVRSLRDQCVEARVPFWFKGWGEWSPSDCNSERIAVVAPDGWWCDGSGPIGYGRDHPGAVTMWRVGRKAAGHLLDGADWHQRPGVTP